MKKETRFNHVQSSEHLLHNTIDFQSQHKVFKTPGVTYSLSSRRIRPEIDIEDYIKIFFMYTPFESVESVFGNTYQQTPFYGGRTFVLMHSLTENHLHGLRELGIHLSLTLTNHYFDDPSYRSSRDFLARHHVPGNSIICVNDKLARRIREEFPDYIVKASIIKNIHTLEDVEESLELYHQVVLPMQLNDNDEFLDRIPTHLRPRIVLFGNATCAYTCPNRTCYWGYSQQNAGKKVTVKCSQKIIPRLDTGDVWFNIRKLKEMGYSQFKLVPLAPGSATAAALFTSGKKARG